MPEVFLPQCISCDFPFDSIAFTVISIYQNSTNTLTYPTQIPPHSWKLSYHLTISKFFHWPSFISVILWSPLPSICTCNGECNMCSWTLNKTVTSLPCTQCYSFCSSSCWLTFVQNLIDCFLYKYLKTHKMIMEKYLTYFNNWNTLNFDLE